MTDTVKDNEMQFVPLKKLNMLVSSKAICDTYADLLATMNVYHSQTVVIDGWEFECRLPYSYDCGSRSDIKEIINELGDDPEEISLLQDAWHLMVGEQSDIKFMDTLDRFQKRLEKSKIYKFVSPILSFPYTEVFDPCNVPSGELVRCWSTVMLHRLVLILIPKNPAFWAIVSKMRKYRLVEKKTVRTQGDTQPIFNRSSIQEPPAPIIKKAVTCCPDCSEIFRFCPYCGRKLV